VDRWQFYCGKGIERDVVIQDRLLSMLYVKLGHNISAVPAVRASLLPLIV
jgi:hypothetical protein